MTRIGAWNVICVVWSESKDARSKVDICIEWAYGYVTKGILVRQGLKGVDICVSARPNGAKTEAKKRITKVKRRWRQRKLSRE